MVNIKRLNCYNDSHTDKLSSFDLSFIAPRSLTNVTAVSIDGNVVENCST